MTRHWWACRTCGHISYDSQGVFAHRASTSHPAHDYVDEHTGPGPGSTPEARAAALEATRQAVAAAKARHQEDP